MKKKIEETTEEVIEKAGPTVDVVPQKTEKQELEELMVRLKELDIRSIGDLEVKISRL